jgi:4-diphosphocytidyl-2-C-methyl-D-erythritol kinase
VTQTSEHFAPAKVNLFLHVGERRPDGFHELESLVVFADAGDMLTLAPADGLSLAVEGLFSAGLATDDNLVLKAARAFAGATGTAPLGRFVLTKNLPVASGLGGGSADAAAALRLLSSRHAGQVNDARLLEIATTVGSDVPACVLSRALMMRGRGEHLDPLQRFPKLNALLVNPGQSVSTAEVFKRLEIRTGTGKVSLPGAFDNSDALIRFLRTTRNDLEAPARTIAPAIRTALDEISRMPGIQIARMTGSGATCFGLFETGLDARMAATALTRSHPDWWIAPTVLR